MENVPPSMLHTETQAPTEIVENKSLEAKASHTQTGAIIQRASSLVPLPEPSAELIERIQGAAETLATLGPDELKLPIIRMTQDGFEMYPGAEPVKEFTGTIIHIKRSNIYYSKAYKPGQVERPDCVSSNGDYPDKVVEAPQAKACKECPRNKFKEGGGGKDCKNTKPIFILVDDPELEGEMSVIPMVLRVSPTSLKNITSYTMSIASKGKFYSLKAKFIAKKDDDSQSYQNIYILHKGKIPAQNQSDVIAVRNQWLDYMENGHFGVDEIDVTPQDVAEPSVSQPSVAENIDDNLRF